MNTSPFHFPFVNSKIKRRLVTFNRQPVRKQGKQFPSKIERKWKNFRDKISKFKKNYWIVPLHNSREYLKVYRYVTSNFKIVESSDERVPTIMDKSRTNLQFRRSCAHARDGYYFTCLTSPPPPIPHTMLKTTHYLQFLLIFNIVICWGVETVTCFKRKAALFSYLSSKTQIIR